ncbi:MAG: hypothetical protein A3A80_02245 [Candidatus Terrybacteria bacterium RIFCSPLOWO2_01_FULL_44_24]|uniref:Uncharacterized protein n=1 Tax=Candidatus Terrybacteria bacterium RIFCSPHIGHO2_01_FULL_43_35 TaxID=1802361 RepID=A0A1G2PGB3_9BACT|nr:MAG: hypothetical protein A2828_02035 [Candidatus Terrybacteria bacterium RIFCSPHIGHO2_01_FULL_43_35]OHA50899.1 MAG: hypothetical protein A3A80_02245 [Candidatus Terrybacteria bacterium RIFCSPLOWO2_01_FULL_44_24]
MSLWFRNCFIVTLYFIFLFSENSFFKILVAASSIFFSFSFSRTPKASTLLGSKVLMFVNMIITSRSFIL